MASPDPEPGDVVMVESGRWRDRQGRFVRWDVIYSGQTRLYPVVRLDHNGREVRVVTIRTIRTVG
jgi:hypothetical protein